MSDAADDCATARAARRLSPRPPVVAPAAIAAGLIALAGCSSASISNSAATAQSAASSTAASTASTPETARASSPTASGTAGTSGPPPAPSGSAHAPSGSAPAPSGTAPTPSGSASAGGPALGRLAGVFAHGAGFGQVRPARIFNGGDPTGLVTRITWSSWGGGKAIGKGTTVYVAPGQSNAQGRQQRVTVVAFRLGGCHGTVMYRAVEWYFPQHGQKFSASHYEDICAGSYAPAP
jgi:hypothetical protein